MYESFVASFVIKNNRPRYSIAKNRSELLDKLCHDWNSVLDARYSVAEGTPKYAQLAKSVIGKAAYCISLNKVFDGKTFNDVSPFHIDATFPVVFVYNENLSWFKTESFPKAAMFFMARK
jgi:hypothetical protein